MDYSNQGSISKESSLVSIEGKAKDKQSNNLTDDLHNVLKVKISSTGYYYHNSVEPNAPNPGLQIEGVGLVGLPLSERDAKAIISIAQAPVGKSKGKALKPPIGDSWDIGAASIVFTNPSWATFVDQATTKALSSLCADDPVSRYRTKPTCELHRLLLYRKGSHFNSKQATPVPKGMFATIEIVLPSVFEGGEIRVSHDGQTAVIGAAEKSSLSVSVLAWYTEVVNQINPITSGYRLALSYNVIHTCTTILKPSLSTIPQATLQTFGKVLERWRDDQYPRKSLPTLPLFAAILAHHYAEKDLDRGLECLRGKDAHLIANLIPIAEKMGIVLCIASLDKRVSGSVDRYDLEKKNRLVDLAYDYPDDFDCDEDDIIPDMLDVEEEEMTVSHLVRIGIKTEALKSPEFILDPKSLVPNRAFDLLKPDDKHYDGDEDGVEHLYHRSALVLFRKKDELFIRLSIKGLSRVVHELQLNNGITPAADRFIPIILSRDPGMKVTMDILQSAIKWSRYDIWNKAIPFVGSKNVASVLRDGLRVFKYDSLQPGISALITQQPTLQARLDVIGAISTFFSDRDRPKQVRQLQQHALISYDSALAGDVPLMVKLVLELEGDAEKLVSAILAKTNSVPGTYDFHINLADAFNNRRLQGAQSGSNKMSILVRQCLIAAASHSASDVPPRGNSIDDEFIPGIRYPASAMLAEVPKRISKLVKLCFSLQEPTLCIEVFNLTEAAHRADVLTAIKECTGTTTTPQPNWIKQMMKAMISAYSNPTQSDIPTIVWIAEELGSEHFGSQFFSNVEKQGTYEFSVALAMSLYGKGYSSQGTDEKRQVAFRKVISRCLLSAVPNWKKGSSAHWGIQNISDDAKVKRVIDFVEQCFNIGDLTPCATLLHELKLTRSEYPRTNELAIRAVHIPLIPRLRSTLTKHGRPMTLEPFKTFFKSCISFYLGHVLSATPSCQIVSIPDATTECQSPNCKLLGDWLRDESRSNPIEFKAAQAARTHIERCITKTGISHLVTHQTSSYGSPRTLTVSKRPVVMSSFKWKNAQLAAKDLVKSIGETDEELRGIMEGQFDSMNDALSGKAVFVIDTGSSSATTAQVAGRKRKQQEVE